MPVQQVTVPDIGGAEGAEVIELLVAVGDPVTVDQGLIVLESDKASMEIPSTVAGTVTELLVAIGDQLAEGAPVAVIEVAAESAQSDTGAGGEAEQELEQGAEREAEREAEPAAKDTAEGSVDAPSPTAGPGERVVPETSAPQSSIPESVVPVPAGADLPPASDSYAGPAVRKMARELGVSLAQVGGSGPHGRILKEDLQEFVRRSLAGPGAVPGSGPGIPAVPDTDFGKFGEIEVTQRSKMDKLTADNMFRSWLNVPHVTQFDDADITDLEEFRAALKAEAQERGTRLTPLPFLLKACAIALRDNPRLNSSLAGGGEELVLKKYIHIGMAVDTPAGLMVPVIRDVDRKSVWELAGEIADLAARARERKLLPGEMQGGSFTVSSLGAIGGGGFTPIVNTPEVGILGVSRTLTKPVWNGAEFVPRKMLPLALSYDHRVVNGGDGGRFLSRLVALLGDIRRLTL